ncbi:MAG: hypothetical protein IPK60_16970 [Sandaracinaceae bacterium]|nr:hypothetical protein [Sandaracinaceae bacterium]
MPHRYVTPLFAFVSVVALAACGGALGSEPADGATASDSSIDGGVIRLDAGPRDAMVFTGDGACIAPGPVAPVVYLPCDPVPAPTECVAGTSYPPAARWSFDPGATTTDTSAGGARPLSPPIMAVAEASAIGGGYAFVKHPDGIFTTSGNANIVTGNNATIELMMRFSQPLDWTGLPAWALGNRTDLFNFGGASFHYSRDEMSVDAGDGSARFTMDGGGVATWAHLADGDWHHVAIVIASASGGLAVTLWIDGESPLEFTQVVEGSLSPLTRVQPGFYASKGVDVDELSLYAQSLPASLIAQRSREAHAGTRPTDSDRCEPRQCTRPAHGVGIVSQFFEPGFDEDVPYAPSMGTLTQLMSAPLPRHKRGHTMPRISSFWTHSTYSVATDDPAAYSHPGLAGSVSQRDTDVLRAPEAEELASRWNYSVSAGLTGHANSYPDDNPYTQFVRSMPDQWPLENMCGITNEGTIGLSVVDAAGDVLGVSPASPLPPYEDLGYANCGEDQGDTDELFGRRIDVVQFDIEGVSAATFQRLATDDWEAVDDLPANVPTRSFCEGLGLPWRECLSKGVSEQHIAMMDGARRDYTQRPAVHVYGVSGNEFYDGDFDYMRLQNEPMPASIDPLSDGSDRFRYSTPYIYPYSSYRWYYTLADRHGVQWLLESRQVEIDAGSPWALPYVAAGWSYKEERNIRPGQWLGMLKIMGAAGALSYVPAFFVIPSELGGSCSWGVCNDLDCQASDTTCQAQTIQNPNHHAWQTLTPSYAQAAISRGEDIMRSASSEWMGALPTNSPSIIATGQRLGTRALIAVALMPNSNDAASHQVTTSTALVGVDHDGESGTPLKHMRFDARIQGSVYIADFATTPATVIQLDAWQEFTHPNWWSRDFTLDAEVFDAVHDMQIASEAPGASTDDYRGLTGYVSVIASRASEVFDGALAGAPHIELDIEARASATYQVWVRLRTTTSEAASAYVWVGDAVGDARQVGCTSNSAWTWVRLDCASGGEASTLSLTGDIEQVLHVAPSHGGVEIDRILLTEDTMCIEDAPSCTCA